MGYIQTRAVQPLSQDEGTLWLRALSKKDSVSCTVLTTIRISANTNHASVYQNLS